MRYPFTLVVSRLTATEAGFDATGGQYQKRGDHA